MHVVRALMKKVRTLAPDNDLGTAFRVVVASAGHRVPVVEGDKLVGVVSEWDVLRAWTKKNAHSLRVQQIMTGNVHTARPSEQLDAVAQRLLDERVGCLPVVEDDKLLGIVTLSDIVKAIGHEHFAIPKASTKQCAIPKSPKR